MAQTLLRVQDLEVYYGRIRALRGVSLDVPEGSIVALLGANGAGKTTTLRAISGLLRATRGTVEFGGQVTNRAPAERLVREGMAHVYMIAPTSNAERIRLVGQRYSGFIYVVSLTGITGVRDSLPPYLTEFIARLRAQLPDAPLVMGFGISKPEQARRMSDLVDGFIVGSALVRVGKNGIGAVRELAGSLRRALD